MHDGMDETIYYIKQSYQEQVKGPGNQTRAPAHHQPLSAWLMILKIIFAYDKGVVLKAITFLPQVKDFNVAILNRPQLALVHIVVNLIRVEVGMVKDHLYQISQFCCVDNVLTNVILQNALAQ
jgi:hypothetical protein